MRRTKRAGMVVELAGRRVIGVARTRGVSGGSVGRATVLSPAAEGPGRTRDDEALFLCPDRDEAGFVPSLR
jgi:hypothetical protein